MRIPVLYKMVENIDDVMKIQLYKDCEFNNADSFLGETDVYWK